MKLIRSTTLHFNVIFDNFFQREYSTSILDITSKVETAMQMHNFTSAAVYNGETNEFLILWKKDD